MIKGELQGISAAIMYNTNRELYVSLGEYLSELANDKAVAMRLVDVFIKADIPLQIFATTVKLYKMILKRGACSLKLGGYKSTTGSTQACPASGILNTYPSTIGLVEAGIASNQIISVQIIPHVEFAQLLEDSYVAIIACCIISCKYYRDIAFTNDSWEHVTSIDTRTLNNAERLSLILLDYEINSLGDGQVIERVRRILQEKGVHVAQDSQSSEKNVRMLVRKLFCLT